MLFDATVTETDGRPTLRVVGDVDLASLPTLQSAVASLEGSGAVIDLSSVDFFDPVCLGVLLAADLRARRRGASVEVVADGNVARLMADTRLDEILAVSPPGRRPA